MGSGGPSPQEILAIDKGLLILYRRAGYDLFVLRVGVRIQGESSNPNQEALPVVSKLPPWVVADHVRRKK